MFSGFCCGREDLNLHEFAEFAGAIARSRSYIGYDSAGQHVAAACGVPLTVYFTGAINDRFRARWRPYGGGPIEVCEVVSGRQ
jgi:ADP-heptose:LPS heptosyltransferase